MPPTLAALAAALADRYRLERELGQGGMATVYLARDLKHDRDVALKVLRPDLAEVLGRQRFLAEIRLTARLDHPHILTLIDSGESEGFLWYVVPFIRGESLRQKLEREKQLGLDQALDIIKQVAGALDYAHRQGVIHRDIKPENILLHEGEATLADFGIALAVREAAGTRLTEAGVSLGSPQYMSPEQATGDRPLDGRSDLYSLAAVFYEMLAGEPPHTGPTVAALIIKLLTERPTRLRLVRDTIPEGIDNAVAKALAKVPADRFGGVDEFVHALVTAPTGTDAAAALPPLWRRYGWRLLAAVAAVAILSVVIKLSSPPHPQPVVHRQVTFSGSARVPALSHDGRWLAYRTGNQLLVQDLTSTADPFVVAAFEGGMTYPRWSFNDSSIAVTTYTTGGLVTYQVPRQGGGGKQVATRRMLLGLYSTGDSLLMVGDSTGSVLLLSPSSGERARSISLAPTVESVTSLAASPDSKWFAFTGVTGGTTFLGITGVDGTRTRVLDKSVPRGASLGWNRSSDAIYFPRDLGSGANLDAGSDLMKIRIDHGTGAPLGGPTVVFGGAFVQDLSVSSDGRRIFYTKAPPHQRITAMRLSGLQYPVSVEARELPLGTGVYGTPDVSPDGKWIAYAKSDGGAGNIYLTPFDSFVPRPLTTSPADEWSPRWSPDGSRIAFTVRDTASPGVAVLEVASRQIRRISGKALAPAGVLAWTGEGTQVVYPIDLGRHYLIVDVTTGTMDSLVAPDSICCFHETVFSPDGKDVLVDAASKDVTVMGLWRGSRRGGQWQKFLGGYWHPLAWNQEGWIYYLGGDGDALWRAPAKGGPRELVARLPSNCSWWQHSLSADARHLACATGTAQPDIWVAENFDPDER